MMSRGNRTAGALLLAGVLLGLPAGTGANGWEHGAVPFEALVAALDSESADMRARAAQSLGYRGEARGVAPLLALLGRAEPSHRVRSTACAALGRLGDPRALPIAEGFYERRRMALRGLGYSASRRAAGVLEGADGLGHPDPRLRALAVRSLAVLDAPGAGARLLPVLRDPVPEVRWTAAMALGRLRHAEAVDALVERLDDAFGEVRRQAALALGYIGEPQASLALARLAIDEPVASVREAALYAMDLLDPAD